MERAATCTFTGHRENKLPWRGDETDARCLRLKQRIFDAVEAVYHSGVRHYICGMANGCDLYFAEAVVALRSERPDVTLEAAIPCGGQPERWNKAQRERYNRLLDQCDTVNVLQIEYTPDCMMKRNRYMVDHASLLLACSRGLPGGTMNTMLYALRQGVKVITIDIE